MAKLKIYPQCIEILDVNDEQCIFKNNVDVLNKCFGANRSMYMHACYPQKKDEFIWEVNTGDKIIVWMPKLYENNSLWKNRVSEDGNFIYEVAEKERTTDWIDIGKHDLDAIRLVFLKPGPSKPYYFAGVFANHSMKHLNHVYKRIATKVKLIGDPVIKAELLDDNRKR